MAFGKIFLSLASSGCQPDGFLIVLKGGWEHRLSFFTETAQFGKQWITQAPRRWINWKESVTITSSSLSLLCFSTHAFLNASAEWELVYCIPCLSGLQGRQGGETEGRESRLIETWRHSFRQVIYHPSDSVLHALCKRRDTSSDIHKTLPFEVKMCSTTKRICYSASSSLELDLVKLLRSYFSKGRHQMYWLVQITPSLRPSFVSQTLSCDPNWRVT